MKIHTHTRRYTHTYKHHSNYTRINEQIQVKTNDHILYTKH